MFSQLRRVPLRRCIHTQTSKAIPKTKPYSLGFVLTASATVITYSTWRWTRDQRIALDSATVAESVKSPVLNTPSSESHLTSKTVETTADSSATSEPAANSEEASEGASQGAYDPVTGEINWDCPCLGGMAHGPCGPEFREAFSCFVYSEEEPKGINCVEKFQAMQTCFRVHPEVYADEIMDDEEEGKPTEDASAGAEQASPSTRTTAHTEQSSSSTHNSASA
ncbi:hypothetical protein GYMLUDRAFT_37428 [Collybiopsis luxurians FD-317 M1]|nr:hypothetical protein GYMLUDRAFT_37428 [Collybiopsis luxurians FD-317 M1]